MADRFLAGLAGLIRSLVGNAIVGPRVDYLAAYPGVAVSQNADGTLELAPDDKRIPGLSKVPIRFGVPGLSATVAGGARVLLQFAGGDPQKPIATLWESASVTSITFLGTTVNLGGSSGLQGAGLGDQLATALANISTWLTTHTHVVPGALGGGPGLTSSPAVLAAPTIGTVSSATVKVKP